MKYLVTTRSIVVETHIVEASSEWRARVMAMGSSGSVCGGAAPWSQGNISWEPADWTIEETEEVDCKEILPREKIA